MMQTVSDKFSINFYLHDQTNAFAYRSLTQVPSVGDRVVFKDERYEVIKVEWCLDEDATNYQYQARINIDIKPL